MVATAMASLQVVKPTSISYLDAFVDFMVREPLISDNSEYASIKVTQILGPPPVRTQAPITTIVFPLCQQNIEAPSPSL